MGRIVCSVPGVAYVHEPFNPGYGRGKCSADFRQWYTFINHDNEADFLSPISNTLNFKYDLRAGFRKSSNIEDFLKVWKEFWAFTYFRLMKKRPLLKDPIALFSAEWLSDRFNMDVVMLIRHPAAFAGSLKRLNWAYPFEDFLNQPLLMSAFIQPFQAEIEKAASKKNDIIDQAILLWRIFHSVIMYYKKRHADWLFIRHEDLSRAPLEGFRQIFSALQIDFTPKIEKVIKKYSDPDNPNAAKGVNEIKISSVSNIRNWKRRLSESEISRIREGTGDIWPFFYSEQDWQ